MAFYVRHSPWIHERIAETSRDAARDAATAKSAGTMWCLSSQGGGVRGRRSMVINVVNMIFGDEWFIVW